MADSEIDCCRIIAHFDVDCFYAQAEILKQQHLIDRPVGITQKFLVVTCNYVARQCGVPKMASIEEARRRCPDIVLINGEDLTPYRAASKKIMNVLRRFGTLERSGLDECGLDITSETKKRAAYLPLPNYFLGFVIESESTNEFTKDDMEEAMVIQTDCSPGRLIPYSTSANNSGVNSYQSNITSGIENELQSISSDYTNQLVVASHLVAEIRAIVEAETGFQCSCGISYNKMLAKLACSANKPNKQTCLLKSGVPGFLFQLSVRKLPGVGHRTETMLKEIGIQTVADLQTCSLQRLLQMFGVRTGHFLFNACRGIDLSPVRVKGPPKSISVEDSFPPSTSLTSIQAVLSSLASDFLARLDEDNLETGRRPRLFTMKWRQKGSGNFTSTSTQMPSELLSTKCSMDRRKQILVQTGMSLMSRSLRGHSFSVVVLNIGATNFIDSCGSSSSASQDIRSLLRNSTKDRDSYTATKHEMVSFREVVETDCSRINHLCPSSFVERLDEHPEEYFLSGDLLCKSSLEMRKSNDEQCKRRKMIDGNAVEDRNAVACRPPSLNDVEVPRLDSSHIKTDYFLIDKDTDANSIGEVLPFPCGCEKQCLQTETINNSTLEMGVKAPTAGVQTNMAKAPVGNIHFQEGNKEKGNSRKEGLEMRDNDLLMTFVCQQCGQEVAWDEQMKQEHEDYHYALELHSQEADGWRKHSNNLARNPYPKKRNQNLTLDSFFFRSK